MKYEIEVHKNADGKFLAYFQNNKSGSAYRIAGPKAWGGSELITKLQFSEFDLIAALKMYAPEVVKKLKEEK